ALFDQGDGLGHAAGLADDLDQVAEFGAHTGQEQAVVVDQDDAPLHDAFLGSRSSTSVPAPGELVTVACPPARSIRPSIDSAMPRRPAGTELRSKPAPRSRTNTETPSSATSR